MTITLHPGPRAPGRRRVALYSHDTQGLGHVRRNIGLAAALVDAQPATDVLLITGAPEATSLPLPPTTDVLTLPTLRKDASGRYTARALDASLDQVLRMRSSIICAAVTSFAPDLFIVDKVARGVDGELDATLAALRATRRCKVVLGLREILDEPDVARREWDSARTTAVLREHYDGVWVYGDPQVGDPSLDLGLAPDVASMVHHTGYLASGRGVGTTARIRSAPRVRPPTQPYVLCLVRGGQDGFALAHAFVQSLMPAGHRGVVLTGPYMRREARAVLRRDAAANPARVGIEEFVPNADAFIASAAAVVSMAGYNSTCELLQEGRPTVLVPRVRPRTEQLLRARRLAALGWVDVLHPDDLGPEPMGRWLDGAVNAPVRRGAALDLDGLARVPVLADALIDSSEVARVDIAV